MMGNNSSADDDHIFLYPDIINEFRNCVYMIFVIDQFKFISLIIETLHSVKYQFMLKSQVLEVKNIKNL